MKRERIMTQSPRGKTPSGIIAPQYLILFKLTSPASPRPFRAVFGDVVVYARPHVPFTSLLCKKCLWL
jgi:hypothetical protein